MTYRDPERRRAYDADKRKQRARVLTKKGIETRLTALEIGTAEDVRGQVNEVAAEVQSADGSSLELEAKLTIKMRAVEIGLRVIEILFYSLSESKNDTTPMKSQKTVCENESVTSQNDAGSLPPARNREKHHAIQG